MVTTFFRLTESRTKGVCRLIEKASRADIRLAGMEHSSLEKALYYCSGQVPVCVYLSFYRALKLKSEMAESLLNSALDP